jgi:hypothetical protein
MQFPEVQAEDFTKITIERLPHHEIESALINIGGSGVEGTQYKTKVIKAAGWKYERLTTYAAHPDVAASAFNKVRAALASTQEQDKLLELVTSG